MCVLAHACAGVRWHACVRDVFAIYENKIGPRLLMIIIKISILYFIQIRHTDDFPSTGTRLVIIMDVLKENIEKDPPWVMNDVRGRPGDVCYDS